MRYLSAATWNLIKFTEYYVNVKDVAHVHIIALLAPDVQSQRKFAFGGPTTMNEMVKILRDLRPDNQHIPDAPANEGRDLSEIVLASKAGGNAPGLL